MADEKPTGKITLGGVRYHGAAAGGGGRTGAFVDGSGGGGGGVIYWLTDSQRDELRRLIMKWRNEAEPVGPLHSLWDSIMEAEDLLAERPVRAISGEVLRIVTSPDEDTNDR